MDRKTEIIQHSQDLVRTIGFSAFSYQDLSDRLGIRKASIHHHFAKKEDLGIAILRSLKSSLQSYFGKVLFSDSGFEAKLDRFLSDSFLPCKDGKTCIINAFLADYNMLSDKARAELSEISEIEVKALTSILEVGLKEGVISPEGQITDLAVLLRSTIKGAIQYARVSGEDNFQTVTEQIKKSILSI
ncbi:MAG: TetR/AcrR family transcriptional regulator [Spirochaetota bacterium]